MDPMLIYFLVTLMQLFHTHSVSAPFSFPSPQHKNCFLSQPKNNIYTQQKVLCLGLALYLVTDWAKSQQILLVNNPQIVGGWGGYCLRQVWFSFQKHSTRFNLCVEEQWLFTQSLSACYPMPNYLFEQSLSAAVHIGFERAAVDSDIWGLFECECVDRKCVYRSRCLCVNSFSANSFSAFYPGCKDILSGLGNVSPQLHSGSTDKLKAQQEVCGFGSNQDLYVRSLHAHVLAM